MNGAEKKYRVAKPSTHLTLVSCLALRSRDSLN